MKSSSGIIEILQFELKQLCTIKQKPDGTKEIFLKAIKSSGNKGIYNLLTTYLRIHVKWQSIHALVFVCTAFDILNN